MDKDVIRYREPDPRSWRLPDITISKKIGAMFLVLILVGLSNVIVVRVMLENLNGVAETINVAGKLRMLSQKIAFEAIKTLRDRDLNEGARTRAALNDFDTALQVLGHGGQAFGYGVQKLPDDLRPQLEAIQQDWDAYRKHTEAALAGIPDTGEANAAINQIGADAAGLLIGSEALVGFLTREAQQAQERALVEIYALFAVDIGILIIFFMFVRRQIAHPLRELAQRSLELANGDYRARMHYQSHDEFGQLAEVFNHSAQQIGKLVARIEQDRHSLQQAESMFRGLAENSVVGVYIAQDNLFRFVNPKMAEMFGYDQMEMSSSVAVFDIVTEDDRHLVSENIQKRLNGEISEVHYMRRARRKDGFVFDVEVFGSRMTIDGQAATIGVVLDITERRRVDRALRVLSACNRALVHATEESALLENICQIVQQVSGYPFVWVGFAENSPAKRVVPAAVSGSEQDDLSRMVELITWDESETGKGVTGCAIRTGKTTIVQDIRTNSVYEPWREFMTRNGVSSAMALPLKANDRVFGALTVYSKETGTFTPDEVQIMEELAENFAYGISALRADAARQHYQRQLEHNANHDILTDLANRNLLSDRLKQAIASARRSGRMVAVLLLDLDHFKVINDSLGHEAGDILLQATADRLRSSVRETDTVARLGGDEFVVVLPDLLMEQDASVVASKILDLLAQSFMIAGQEIYVNASIGISLYPRDGVHEDILLKNVDLAMYHVKQKGRAGYHFYTEELNARNRERHELQTELRYALSRGELVLHYQPKVEPRTRKLVGVEALVRWQHPERGLISPANFIPFAEETGLIIPIGAWVMETACRQNLNWQMAGLAPINIAVNLSASQFRHQDLVSVVRQTLENTGMAPRYLELELTESVLIQEADEAVPTLQGLKNLGVQLSLDDFGTGYSSLNYLRRFPLDNLKIDRSFVKGITTNASDTTIIKSVVALAHNLNLKVIAEGVELRQELEFLTANGCEEIQGYYFSKPLPPDQFQRLLESGIVNGADD